MSDAVQNQCKRRLCRSFQWHCWALGDQDLPSKTTVLWLLHSTWSIPGKWPVISSIHNEESSQGKFNHIMMHEHFMWGLYWEVKVTALIYPNDVWLIQSRISGACPLICWCLSYVHVSSKMKELMCVNGYLWWHVKWLLYFKVSPSNCLGDVVIGPNLSLSTDHMSLSYSLDFDGVQWSRCRTCSGLNLLLLSTLHPCRFPFYMQVIILMRSDYRLSSLAVTSVYGCCLYIVIHNSILHRSWL